MQRQFRDAIRKASIPKRATWERMMGDEAGQGNTPRIPLQAPIWHMEAFWRFFINTLPTYAIFCHVPAAMAHTQKDKPRLLARIRRLQGQLEGLHRAIDEGKDCGDVLHTLSAFRGAVNGLMLEVLEGHIRHHIMSDGEFHEPRNSGEGAEELIAVLRKYLR
jgi:DNA-binding FrmR family transcriptional regulator